MAIILSSVTESLDWEVRSVLGSEDTEILNLQLCTASGIFANKYVKKKLKRAIVLCSVLVYLSKAFDKTGKQLLFVNFEV